jgi:hypothetical protein
MATSQTFEQFEADLQARQKAVASAGWTGLAARVLLLKGEDIKGFTAVLSEANTIRAIANMVRPQLAEMHIDVDHAIERSVVHGFPLAEVRQIIIQRLAENDEATHTDATRAFKSQAEPGDVYAERKAQMKAGNVK